MGVRKMSERQVNALIYGSCVSRDIARVLPELLKTKEYVARQSWISGFSSGIDVPDLSHVASNFQARSLAGDFASNATKIIRQYGCTADTVIVDIASDRHGIAKYEGGFVSLTPDHQRAFGGMIKGGVRIKFGSARHQSLFEWATRRASTFFERHGLKEKVLVIQAPFTDTTSSGVPMVKTRLTAEQINEAYQPYYRTFEDAGFALLKLPEDLAIADPGHAWGLAQDHYISAAYEWLAREIQAFSSARGGGE